MLCGARVIAVPFSVQSSLTPHQIKCSGDKTGCARCKTLRIGCIYAESWVGRVPGIRAKRKQNPNGSVDIPVPANPANSTRAAANETIEIDFSFPSISSLRAELPSPSSITPGSFEDGVLDWPTELAEPRSQALESNITNNNNSDKNYAFNNESIFESLMAFQHVQQQQQLPQQERHSSPPGGHHAGNSSRSRMTFSRSSSDSLNNPSIIFDLNDSQSNPQSPLTSRGYSHSQSQAALPPNPQP